MSAGVVPIRRRTGDASFAPGVPPFDRSNPAHVRAWNAIFALGEAEARRHERG